MTGIRSILQWQLDHDYFDSNIKMVVEQFLKHTENPVLRAYCPKCDYFEHPDAAEKECENCRQGLMVKVWLLNPLLC